MKRLLLLCTHRPLNNKKPAQWAHFVALAALNLVACFCQAQQTAFVSGKVIDDKTGAPVVGCSVYFSNTSKGDVTSDSGDFMLQNLAAGRYDLVVSAIGYQTEVIAVSSADYPHDLKVKLHNIAEQLAEVVLQPTVINGWEKWGQAFLDNFIGTVPNSSKCRILNPEVIKFWFSQTKNRLTVRADNVLTIENKALGYTIKFTLKDFILDYAQQTLVYSGFPLFQEMTDTDEKKQREWKENRLTAYYGSMLHFIRTVYNDKWSRAGYDIVAWIKRPNLEKQRVKQLLATTTADKADSTGQSAQAMPKDTSRYYHKVLKQADSLSSYVWMNSIDSFIAKTEDQGKSLFFTGKWKIQYKRFPKSKSQQSEIYLGTPEAIRIEENGSYFSPKELIFSQHWAESEKMANLLPYDYEP